MLLHKVAVTYSGDTTHEEIDWFTIARSALSIGILEGITPIVNLYRPAKSLGVLTLLTSAILIKGKGEEERAEWWWLGGGGIRTRTNKVFVQPIGQTRNFISALWSARFPIIAKSEEKN